MRLYDLTTGFMAGLRKPRYYVPIILVAITAGVYWNGIREVIPGTLKTTRQIQRNREARTELRRKTAETFGLDPNLIVYKGKVSKKD